MPIQSTSEGKISLAKGIIFTKIGLANGYIFKLWAAPPYPKFSREPPPRVIVPKVFRALLIDYFVCHDGSIKCDDLINVQPITGLEVL